MAATKQQACDRSKTCGAPENVACDPIPSMCKISSDGVRLSWCRTDANCSESLPGLKCNPVSGIQGFGQCDCTSQSRPLPCDVDKICVLSNDVTWPDGLFPGATDEEKSRFTGSCDAPTSDWHNLLTGAPCRKNELECPRPQDSARTCITSIVWDAISEKDRRVYSHFCLAP